MPNPSIAGRAGAFLLAVTLLAPAAARAEVEVVEGNFGGATYTLARDSEFHGADALLLIPAPAGLHAADDQADNRIVTGSLDLVSEGLTLFALDATRNPGFRIVERTQELRDFAQAMLDLEQIDGDLFVAGETGTGTLVHLLLEKFPTEFAGGVADSGVGHLNDQFDYLAYDLVVRHFTFQSLDETLEQLLLLQDALGGPLRDRRTRAPNPRLLSHSPVFGADAIEAREILLHGDSDERIPVFHHHRFTDAMVAAGNKSRILALTVPAGGRLAPGRDAATFYGDLVRELVQWTREGSPPNYEAGAELGPRHTSAERRPRPADLRSVEQMSAAPSVVSIRLEGRIGQGSHLAGWNDGLRVADLDGDGASEILVGDAEGFVHCFEWNGAAIVERWRSSDLGSLTFAIAPGAVTEGADPRLYVANYAGEIHRIEPTDPDGAFRVFTDALEMPIVDLAVARLGMADNPVLLYRSFDGFLVAVDPDALVEIGRSPYLGPTPGTGMDRVDLDGDGTDEIVVGNGGGEVLLLSGTDLSIVARSDPIGFYPHRVHFAEVTGASPREIVVSGTTDGSREGGSAVHVVLDLQLAEKRRTTRLGPYRGFEACYGAGHRQLLLGTKGEIVVAQLGQGGSIRRWTHPHPDERVTGIACGDLAGDGSSLLAVATAEGSLTVVDRASLETLGHLPGLAGGYGLALSELDRDRSFPEILVGRRPAGVAAVHAPSRSIVSQSATPEHWNHALRGGDVDGDGRIEIVTGSGEGVAEKAEDLDGFVSALKFDLTPEWTTENPEAVLDGVDGSIFGLDLADFDFDGRPEVVIGTDASPDHELPGSPVGFGRVRLLSGASGETLVSAEIEGHDFYGLSTGDVTGDGLMDVVVGDRRGFLHILTPADPHQSLERIFVSDDLGSRLVGIEIVELDGVLPPEILVGNEEGLIRALRWDGSALAPVHEVTGLGSHAFGFFAADLGGAAGPEILSGNANGDLYVFDAGLELLASLHGLGAFPVAYGAALLADVDGDGFRELAVGSSGYLYLFELRNAFDSGPGTLPPGSKDPTGLDHAPPPPLR